MLLKNIATLILMFCLLGTASAQNWDSIRGVYPWMQLRDSSKALNLRQIQISSDHDSSQHAFHETTSFNNVDEYLERSPGLSMIGRGAFGKEPVLNGMNTNRVQVTIDGMPVMHACIGKMDPATSYVETNNLEKVEIGNGGEGLALTSDVGGNINFQTLDPQIGTSQNIYGNAGVEYATNGNGRYGLLKVGFAREKWGVLVNGTYRSRDSYTDGNHQLVHHSQYNKANVALAAKWMINEKQVLDADLIIDEAWEVGYPALPMDVPIARAQIASLEWKYYQPNKSWDWWKVKVFGNRVHHVMDNFSRTNYAMLMTMPGDTRVAGWRTQARHSKQRDRHWDFQAEVLYKNFLASMTMFPENEREMYMLNWPDVGKWSAALVAGYEQSGQRHQIKWQGRFEGIRNLPRSDQGIHQWQGLGAEVADPDYRLSGGLSGTYFYHLSAATSLMAKAALVMRPPTVSEQYGLYIYNAMDGFSYLGDPGIANEKSAQVTLGLNQQGQCYQLESEVYYYQFWDYITGVIDETIQPLNQAHNGVKRYTNLTRANMLGWNASIHIEPAKKWRIYFAGEYTRGRDDKGVALPLIPPFSLTGGGKFLFNNGFVSAEVITAATQHQVSPYNGEDATPGYAVVNLTGNYQFNVGSHTMEINASADNLTNAFYWHHLDWNNVPQMGRNFSIGMRWKF